MALYTPKTRSGMKKIKASASAASESSEASCEQDSNKSYCIFLHVVEGINFNVRGLRDVDLSCPTSSRNGVNEKVIMNASLNGTQFEVEGAVGTVSETTLFNSNILWECDLPGIKRLKTDNRPVKMVFYIISSSAGRKVIGSLLLPLRGLPIMSNSQNIAIKMFWHKLSCLGNEWRSMKPEVNLMLAIVKKSLLKSSEFEGLINCNKQKSERSASLQSPERSLTGSMLESQANIYVQALSQLGLIQLGNEPNVDCDIIEVTLYLKELRNVNKTVRFSMGREPIMPLILILDFVGNLTTVEMMLNDSDSYQLSEKVGFRFKTSFKTLRLYFQRIFYLPINMYYNGDAIANYRMEFCKYLPEDSYFTNSFKYTTEDCFYLDPLCSSARSDSVKPCVEFTFTVELLEINSHPSAERSNLLLEYNDDVSKESDLLNSQATSSSNLHSRCSTRYAHAYAREQKTLNIHKLERMETNEKVAAWCEEVFKTHQQLQLQQQKQQQLQQQQQQEQEQQQQREQQQQEPKQQQKQSRQRTVRERVSDWPPPEDEIDSINNRQKSTTPLLTQQPNQNLMGIYKQRMMLTPCNEEIPLNENYEQSVESSDSVVSEPAPTPAPTVTDEESHHTGSSSYHHTASTSYCQIASPSHHSTASTSPHHTDSSSHNQTASSSHRQNASASHHNTASTSPHHTDSSSHHQTASSSHRQNASASHHNTASKSPHHTDSSSHHQTASTSHRQNGSASHHNTDSTSPYHTDSSSHHHTASSSHRHTDSSSHRHTDSSSVKRSKGGNKTEDETATTTNNNVPQLKDFQMNIIKELENWRAQEMEKFDLELKRKTNYHLKKLEKQQKQQQSLSSGRSSSDSKINRKSSQGTQMTTFINNEMNDGSNKSYNSHYHNNNNNAKEQHEQQVIEQVKKEMGMYYRGRFDDLESYIIRLKDEMEGQLRHFQARQIEAQNENIRLAQEKLELIEHTNEIARQLAQSKQQHDTDQIDIRKLLSDLSLQNERFFQMEKSRNFYKEQWQKAVQRTHKLELELLKYKERLEDEKDDLKFKFDLSAMIAESEVKAKHSTAKIMASSSSTTESSSSVEYVSGYIDDTLSDSD